MARPTILDQNIVDKAQKYVDDTSNLRVQNLLPTIEGLAMHLGVNRDTVYDWEKIPETDERDTLTDSEQLQLRQQFSDIVKSLRSAQAEKLIQNSLLNRYNASIAKMILSGKHGYVEKSEQDITSKGEKLAQPADVSLVDAFIENLKNDTADKAKSD